MQMLKKHFFALCLWVCVHKKQLPCVVFIRYLIMFLLKLLTISKRKKTWKCKGSPSLQTFKLKWKKKCIQWIKRKNDDIE